MAYKFSKKQTAYIGFKRVISFLGSFVGIVVFSVFFWWWIIIINTFVTKGHPFYKQERIGKNKKVFKLLKFRSMKNGCAEIPPSEMTKEMHNSMETGFGRFLRKTSLDETPQLLNIFVGQMSFVGPRPGAAHNEEHLITLRDSYTPSAFEVRPGLTGYAQVLMKRGHNPEEKAKYDSEYVRNISFGLDIKLFFSSLFNPFN